MKKIKLFLSLCMMCLCVAVLCMGILAAGSATYKINGNISYNMIDGVARVNARVYKVAGTGTLTSDQLTSGYITTLATMELEDISKSTSPNYILTETKDTIAINQDGKTVGLSANIVYGANTDQSTYYTYFIVLNITNQSSDTGYVLNAYLDDLGTSTISNIASNANGSDNPVEIKSGKFTNIVIGLSYNGGTISDSNKTFDYTLNVSYEEKAGLTLYDGGTYYYANLGYTDTNKSTPIKWRYVGYETTVNNVTTFNQITYTTGTIPEIKSGAIFVQETALGSFSYTYDGTNTISVSESGSAKWGSSSALNYFTSSSLRTSIKGGGLFNLTETEQKYLGKYIKARTLPDISWSCLDGNAQTFSYPYTSKNKYTSAGNGTDYFWLMSVDELFTYFTSSVGDVLERAWLSHSEFVWKPSGSSVSFWLRSPCYNSRSGYSYVQHIATGGSFEYNSANTSDGVRAAFQLT